MNFYEATLSAPLGASDLVISLSPAPSISEGWLLIDYDDPSKREFIYFTSKDATSVTVPSLGAGRGQDGTSAVSHDQNAKVRMNVNAGILKGLRDGSAITGLFPAGLIMPYGGSSAPTGFLLCDGTAYSRASYSTLFAAIGTSYGSGDGSTTFNVPDAKGRSLFGYSAADSLFNALGKTGGQTTVQAHTHTGTTSTVGDHTHPTNTSGMSVFTTGSTNRLTLSGSAQEVSWGYTSTGGGGSHNHSFTTASSGSGSNNLNPYLVTQYIIKT